MTQDKEYYEYKDSIDMYKAKIARWNALVEKCRPECERLGHSYIQVAAMIAEREGWWDADIQSYEDNR